MSPGERSMTGYETEQFVLRPDGSLDHSGELVEIAREEGLPIQAEVATAMIETSCLPASHMRTSARSLVETLERLVELAHAHDRQLFPFGVYFGRNEPRFRERTWYEVQREVLGPDRFEIAGRCCGCHQHHSLPREAFDYERHTIRYDGGEGTRGAGQTLVDAYNLLTAADPVFVTLTQSSPFVDGVRVAKNGRALLYRGGSWLGFPDGMYGEHGLFGALWHYESSLEDLLSTVRDRPREWLELMRERGWDEEALPATNALELAWNPVRVNEQGTLEYRGNDMNFTSVLVAVSVMMEETLRELERDEGVRVVPGEIEVEGAFRVEGNRLLLPSFPTVKELERRAVHAGLEDDRVHAYARRFLDFVERMTHGTLEPLLRPVERMVAERRTVSDRILEWFGKEEITGAEAREGALHFAEAFEEDLRDVKEKLYGLAAA